MCASQSSRLRTVLRHSQQTTSENRELVRSQRGFFQRFGTGVPEGSEICLAWETAFGTSIASEGVRRDVDGNARQSFVPPGRRLNTAGYVVVDHDLVGRTRAREDLSALGGVEAAPPREIAWHNVELAEVIEALETRAAGLEAAEARRRL